jgi:predicted membrane-bound spermidine synthase
MRRYLYFTVFVSGMTSLAAEFCASRLLGNVFGTSNLVWASIIGLILIYLTLGYFLGGRWADRSPYPKTMYAVLAWGAFTLGIVPFVATPVLRAAASAFDGLELGIVAGSFAAVLVLFIVPVTLLGTISPFAIRISMDDASHAGNISGNVYAISTLGSFLGTFIPVLVLIPTVGTTKTMLLFSASLLLVALIGLGLSGGRRAVFPYLLMVGALVAIALWGLGGGIKRSAGQIFETESAYNYIQVQQINGFTLLRLNDGQGIHSMYHPTQLAYGGPWEEFLVGPFFNSPPYSPTYVKRIAIVGLAAGTTARQATAVYGPIPIDGIEIDPVIVDVGRKYFGMTMPNLNVIVGDGRWELEHSPYKYDIIAVDAYRPPYIPPHLTTQEFFRICADHLTNDGVLAINVGRAPGDRRLIDDLAATIGTLLPSIYVMDVPNTFNSVIYATRQPTSAGNLHANLLAISSEPDIHPLLLTAIQVADGNLQPTPHGGIVFTDDLAPIEWITNNMILHFVLGGGVGELK